MNVSTDLEQRVTGRGGNPPGQGPFINVTLRVVSGTIAEATFETYQCPGCIACGKAICELVRGKTLEAAGTIRHPELLQVVGPLPKHRQICYGLALVALDDALRQLKSQGDSK
jgi:NifU-like protein involved in Fe-S cluster formation